MYSIPYTIYHVYVRYTQDIMYIKNDLYVDQLNITQVLTISKEKN